MPGRKASSPAAVASPRKSPRGKGKEPAGATSSAPATDSPAAKRTRLASEEAAPPTTTALDGNDMLALAQRIADNAHLLVRGRGSDELAEQARDVLKRSFDHALQSETFSFPHLSTLLASLSPSAAPSTRSATAAAAAAAAARPSSDDEPFVLAQTPISELTTSGMDSDMIWEQMELRGRTVDGLMEEMFGQTEEDEDGGFDDAGSDEDADMDGAAEDEDEDEGEFDDDGDDADGADLTPEEAAYYRRLGEGKEEGLDSDDSAFLDGAGADFAEGDVEGEEEEEERDEEERDGRTEEEDAMTDPTRSLTLDNFDGAQKRGSRSRRAPSAPSAVDDAFFSLHDFHVDADEGEFEMERMLKGESLGDSDDEGGEDGIDLFAPVGGLGDGSEDEDEDEEEGDLDAAGVMYKDFFDPPSRPPSKTKKAPSKPAAPAASTAKGKRGVRFSEAVRVKEIPHRLAGKRAFAGDEDDEDDEDDHDEGFGDADDDEVTLADLADEDEQMGVDSEDDREGEGLPDEDEEDDEEGDSVEMDQDDDVEEGQETIDRFKNSLFDDEEEDEPDQNKNLSRHERRLLQLSSQIASLEAENVGPKKWATQGEAQARDRPMDSLLEEDLEFERMGKVAPVVTEDTTKTIEDLIKKRILDSQFDDVERRRPVDPNAFLPSRYMELQDSKSQKSLAEVYEDEFRDARDREQGREVVHELDKDLQKRHDEIEALFEDLAARLDALSNARFTPKAPKATITTVSNLPSISVESALPTTNSTSTLLAPEEVYSASGSTSALAVDKADLTPAQKKAQRQKAREQRKSQHEKADRILAAKQRRKGVKGEKERAEQILLGTKGVTVIGKNGAEKSKAGKKRKRGDGDGMGAGQPSGVGLKL
ncbi:hypothetical protein JCM8097_004248 [Rhodosporidiobolus ruineniae]